MSAAEGQMTDVARDACGDRWDDEMACTLPRGHRGLHVDERVFGSVIPDVERVAAVRDVLNALTTAQMSDSPEESALRSWAVNALDHALTHGRRTSPGAPR